MPRLAGRQLTDWTAGTRFGPQPILQIMRQRGARVSRLALAIGVTYGRLNYVVHGATAPFPREVNKLAAELGAMPGDLFTDEARYAGGGER